ncbi:sensor histidine kinase [[Clostridium] fimetarium]|uniref:histidine kinase n=1 Tax=[Clostridium] fimetarium TaxID=99656 RepID=A0A1I0NMK5_9FIRM|nr:ATP-binding protein [[Clostridium] fimetarium]SEW02105.1 Signal transduction histidine kinase [[Clostridium] fimetarium]
MNNEGKRVTSTARKIKYMWLAKLFSAFLSVDIMIAFVFVGASVYFTEKQGLGNFKFDNYRAVYNEGNNTIYEAYSREDSNKKVRLFITNDLKSVTYQVIDNEGLHDVTSLDMVISILNTVVIWLLCIQLFILIGDLFTSARQIRRTLQPLNELAQTTSRLSNISFDESKVHSLEDAIAKISPTGPNGTLNTTDEDLKGLEAAINCLLERMRESYRQQSRFVSDASHELRTPIAVIQGYVNMLDRWGKEDETILNESIEAIKNESEQMKKLVEQLLFLARGDSGRNQLNFETFSLNDMLQEVYEESLMIDENHMYEFKGDSEAFVYADMSMLKQTARILVDNAAKYTLEKDVISLRCGINNEGISYFSVQDNGIGMKELDVGHVFERFYRSDVARDKKTGGTGLGLSIAKWIIEKHEGYFEVLSREEIGTRITVVLPLKNI